eukprot:UN18329
MDVRYSASATLGSLLSGLRTSDLEPMYFIQKLTKRKSSYFLEKFRVSGKAGCFDGNVRIPKWKRQLDVRSS